MCIFVDDGLICSNSKDAISNILKYLNSHFEMRSHPVEQFVGLAVSRDRIKKKLFLSQPHYIKTKGTRKIPRGKLQTKRGTCRPKRTASSKTTRQHYWSWADSVPRSCWQPTLPHHDNTSRHRICSQQGRPALRKLGSVPFGIRKENLCIFQRGPALRCFNGNCTCALTGYTDSDYAGDQTTRHSTTGFVCLFNDGPIFWCSCRQTCVALSTTEAEFVAASETAKEAVWLRRFFSGIGAEVGPLPLLCDNQSAIWLVKNPEFHQRTKHIDVKIIMTYSMSGRRINWQTYLQSCYLPLVSQNWSVSQLSHKSNSHVCLLWSYPQKCPHFYFWFFNFCIWGGVSKFFLNQKRTPGCWTSMIEEPNVT